VSSCLHHLTAELLHSTVHSPPCSPYPQNTPNPEWPAEQSTFQLLVNTRQYQVGPIRSKEQSIAR
jgi:hypothetical protein